MRCNGLLNCRKILLIGRYAVSGAQPVEGFERALDAPIDGVVT